MAQTDKLFIIADTFRTAKWFTERRDIKPGDWLFLRYASQLDPYQGGRFVVLTPNWIPSEQLDALTTRAAEQGCQLITEEEL